MSTKGTEDDPLEIAYTKAAGQPLRYFASHCGRTTAVFAVGTKVQCDGCKQWVVIVGAATSATRLTDS